MEIQEQQETQVLQVEASLATLLQIPQVVAYLEVAQVQQQHRRLAAGYLDQLHPPPQGVLLPELLALLLAVARRSEEVQLLGLGLACLEVQRLLRQVTRLEGPVYLGTPLAQTPEPELHLRVVACLATPQILHRLQQFQRREQQVLSAEVHSLDRNLPINLKLPNPLALDVSGTSI